MSRAIILPAIGDPYLLMLWYKVAKKYFLDEVDHVYIQIDHKRGTEIDYTLSDKQIKKYLEKDKKISVALNEVPGIVSSLDYLIKAVKEDCILFAQEDSFIFQRNIVNFYFQNIENNLYDVVGTPMLCYTPEASQFLTDILGDEPWSLKSCGYAFWPNFFFCKREDLLKTSMDFNITTYQKDDLIPFLNVKAPLKIDFDVFANICIELRALKLRFHYEMQNTDWWTHLTCLSSIFNYFSSPWSNPYQVDDNLRREFERRYYWWAFAYRKTCRQGDFVINDLYKKVIDLLPKMYNFDRYRLKNGIKKIERMLKI